MEIDILKLNSDAVVPSYQTDYASGVDLHACSDMIIKKNEIGLVPTGIAVSIPKGYEGQVRPRSGLALKHGILVPNSPGTIDCDYRGEIKIILINLGKEDFIVKKKDRIAQLVFNKVERAELVVVDKLDNTSRGAGGFGSTGKR